MVSGPILSEPAGDLAPLQSPLALQVVGLFVESHVRVTYSPGFITAGEDDKRTDGLVAVFPLPAGGGVVVLIVTT